MKMLLVLAMLSLSSAVSAAGVTCVYQDTPCDEVGNHYFCSAFGWSNHTFCSPSGNSRNPGRFFINSNQEEVAEENLQCEMRPEVCGLNSEYCIDQDQPQLNYCRRL